MVSPGDKTADRGACGLWERDWLACKKMAFASLPVRCGSAVTQFKMADKLVAALNDKRNLTGIKKALIFTEGKNTLKNYGVFVFEFLGS